MTTLSTLQIRVGLQNYFQAYSTTILPTRTAIQKQSLTKHAGGYWQYETQFEIIISAKRLARDNVDAQLGNVEREIQRLVCQYNPNDIDGIEDMLYMGQDRIYGFAGSWVASEWMTRILIAVRYHVINDSAF